MEIGQRIKEYREKRGLTQTQLGHLMGVEKSAVCQVERGHEKNLTIDRLMVFADALGCEVSDLIGITPKDNEAISKRNDKAFEMMADVYAENKALKHTIKQLETAIDEICTIRLEFDDAVRISNILNKNGLGYLTKGHKGGE